MKTLIVLALLVAVVSALPQFGFGRPGFGGPGFGGPGFGGPGFGGPGFGGGFGGGPFGGGGFGVPANYSVHDITGPNPIVMLPLQWTNREGGASQVLPRLGLTGCSGGSSSPGLLSVGSDGRTPRTC
ncbi:uncharacterized protein Dyak_GE13461 [Drosophila yakuba]|uniref:CG10853-PA n=1 Tax=Drosophila yakuba TaxID=7245 RepID=B4P0S7_DROYA|nr:uncharacterized protein Dyak_GE13461 [Drosophila yakuba]